MFDTDLALYSNDGDEFLTMALAAAHTLVVIILVTIMIICRGEGVIGGNFKEL